MSNSNVDIGNSSDWVILYGAGNNAEYVYRDIRLSGLVPVCFGDSSIEKHTNGMPSSKFFDLPVMSMEDILATYPNIKIYITPKPPVKYEIIEMLTTTYGIAKELIINYEPYTKCIICESLLNMMILEKGYISTCCHVDIEKEQTTLIPSFDFSDLSEPQMWESFLKMRETAVDSLNNGGSICKGCHEARTLYTCTKGTKITNVAFGTGFICQLNCMYCNHTQQDSDVRIRETEQILRFWKYLKTKKLVDDSTVVGIANGEITINPLFDDIMSAFSDHACTIATNGIVFRDKIAEKLTDGISKLNISLDCGTPSTYKTIKGLDTFDIVCQNIRQYSRFGEVLLKYILIPGINDNTADIDNFIDLAAEIHADVILSRDFYGSEIFDLNIDKVIDTVSYFLKQAKKLGVFVSVDGSYKIGRYRDLLNGVINENHC